MCKISSGTNPFRIFFFWFFRVTPTFRRSKIKADSLQLWGPNDSSVLSFTIQSIGLIFSPSLGLKSKNQGIIFLVHRDYTCNSHRFWSTMTSSSLSKAPVQSWRGQQWDPAVGAAPECPAQRTAPAPRSSAWPGDNPGSQGNSLPGQQKCICDSLCL